MSIRLSFPNRFQKIIERSENWDRAECNFDPEYLARKHDENIREEIRRANTGATPSQASDQTGGGSPIATPAGLLNELGLGGMK